MEDASSGGDQITVQSDLWWERQANSLPMSACMLCMFSNECVCVCVQETVEKGRGQRRQRNEEGGGQQ